MTNEQESQEQESESRLLNLAVLDEVVEGVNLNPEAAEAAGEAQGNILAAQSEILQATKDFINRIDAAIQNL